MLQPFLGPLLTQSEASQTCLSLASSVLPPPEAHITPEYLFLPMADPSELESQDGDGAGKK